MSFIDSHDFPTGLVLRVLGIAESTYYDWRARQAIVAFDQRKQKLFRTLERAGRSQSRP
jgi:putative transposase